eukprot:TRINITY_DN5246_c0_g1_i2.p1 TRINITY_DN5246_c0_g1~~TRINITY_DN5246_c0_g1_i2.p1  ORF type:complete len:288 (-),score=48.58 TRINITY_DN5246_c0_g1_i2:16-879(-)
MGFNQPILYLAMLLACCTGISIKPDQAIEIPKLEVDGVDVGAKLLELGTTSLSPQKTGPACGAHKHGDMSLIDSDRHIVACLFGRELTIALDHYLDCSEVSPFVDGQQYTFINDLGTVFNASCSEFDGHRWMGFEAVDLDMTFTSNKALTATHEYNDVMSQNSVVVPYVADSTTTTSVVSLALPFLKGTVMTASITIAKTNGLAGGLDDSAASTSALSPTSNSVAWGSTDGLIYAGGTLGGQCLTSVAQTPTQGTVSLSDPKFIFGLSQISGADYEGCDFAGMIYVR